MTTIGGCYFPLPGGVLPGVGVTGVDPPELTLAGVVTGGPCTGAEGRGAAVVEVVARGATLTRATLLRALLSVPAKATTQQNSDSLGDKVSVVCTFPPAFNVVASFSTMNRVVATEVGVGALAVHSIA